MLENQRVTDALEVALHRAKGLVDGAGLVGYGVVELRGPDGSLKQVEPFTNIVTTSGDKFYAQVIAQSAGGAAPSPGSPTGMKLGTGTTAATKSGAASALGAYISGSNKTFTATTVAAVVSGDTGWTVAYECTWVAGVATNTAITEVVIVNDAVTNATATAANTYARAVIALVNKGAQDSLTVTWKHLFLGGT